MNEFENANNENYNNAENNTSNEILENSVNESGFRQENAYGNAQAAPVNEQAAAAPQVKPKKRIRKRRIAAVLAGLAVIGCAVGFGRGKGLALREQGGGIAAANGGDIYFNESGDSEVTPIVYTTNYSSITEVFNSVESSIVNISMTVNTTNFWNQSYETEGSGSGIIYKIDGDNVYIATNNHVVEGANKVSISVTGEEQVTAALVGKDAANDLAVIKVSKADLNNAGITNVKAAEFVSSDTSEIGETVLAIGNALGEGKSVTMGIISARNKNINIDGKNLTVIQTDAAINPGNSGGALVNLDGKVIGINTAKTGSGTVEGMGYAIPSYTAVTVLNQLIQNGTVEKPYLGVVCYTINDSFRQMYNINISGVFIQEVSDDSAAEKAGLRATDIIVAINGTAISTQQDLQSIISGCNVGDSIEIKFVRNGREEMSTTAVLENYNEKF